MRKLASAIAIAILLPWGVARAAAAPVDGSHVVVLANSEDPDSLLVADHYAQARGVPRANVIAFPMSMSETITWREFVDTIWQPVQDELVARGLIDALLMDGRDSVGRRQYAISGHSITALVVCRGVPLRVSDDPALYKDYLPFTKNPQLRTNQGAVDSELSLLAFAGYTISAFVPNPLFGNDRPSDLDRSRVVIVGRLDGPSAADACALVDNALQAERQGLLGRAYVDMGGPHAEGDVWLDSVAKQIDALGFDLSVDREPSTFPPWARFDAPVLYFGWYSGEINGPFLAPGFRFPPGAIAMHIHSFSAHTLRSGSKAWCGPLVARGVTATVGNVFEPYLEFTHRPDLLLRALARGRTMGEAAFYALPFLSWQGILVGDPLYRPFGGSPSPSSDASDPGLADLRTYEVVRQANLLRRSGDRAGSLALLQKGFDRAPSMPLALRLSEDLVSVGDRAGAARVLRLAIGTSPYPSSAWGMAHACAQMLSSCEDHPAAFRVYELLMGSAGMDRSLRMRWLADAEAEALRAGEADSAHRWKAELDQLVSEVLANPAG